MTNMLNRSTRKAIGTETVAILKAQQYTSASGKVVSLKKDLDVCLAGTRVIAGSEIIPPPPPSATPRQPPMIFEVTTESTLSACQRLYHRYNTGNGNGGKAVLITCLNFASAHTPGGGFLAGSQAQEESLARNSTLYASQTAHPGMYRENGQLPRGHQSAPHTLYSDAMLYSPNVVVFRDEDEGTLLSTPFPITVVSAPAPNAGATLMVFGKKGDNADALWAMINTTLRRRLERVLALCYHEGCEVLVLGAYGCGVFRNSPTAVAEACKDLLQGDGPYANVFCHVTFAIYSPCEQNGNYRVFKDML